MSEAEDSVVQAVDLTDWMRTTMAPYIVHGSASLSCVLLFVWTLHWQGSLSLKSPDLFNFHPLLHSLAFVLIVPESILLMRFSGFRKPFAKPFHATLHLIALLFAILAVVAAYKYHADNKFAHFRSLHSWIGLATVVIFISQWLFGVVLFYRMSGAYKARFKPFHIYIGLIVVFLSSLTLVTGVMERTVFVGSCSSGVSRECLVANGSVLMAIVSFIAFATAITATTSPRYRRSSLDDALLPSRSVATMDDDPVRIDA